MCVYMYTCLFSYLCFHLHVHMSSHYQETNIVSVRPSARRPPAFPSVCLSVCLSVRLSMYMDNMICMFILYMHMHMRMHMHVLIIYDVCMYIYIYIHMHICICSLFYFVHSRSPGEYFVLWARQQMPGSRLSVGSTAYCLPQPVFHLLPTFLVTAPFCK